MSRRGPSSKKSSLQGHRWKSSYEVPYNRSKGTSSKESLNDGSLIVKKVIEKEVISSWLRMSENAVCRYLSFLDITKGNLIYSWAKNGYKTAAFGYICEHL